MAEETKKETTNFGFPSHDIPPIKKNKKWHLQYSQAFHKEFTNGTGKILRWAKDDYEKWRLYARGKQPIDQYKELMGMKKRNGKWDKTWRNLDWNILPIFPRFKTVIKNRLLKQPREMILQAIDQTSISNNKKKKAEMLDYIANKDFYDQLAKLGVQTPSPFEQGEPIPENAAEVDIHLQMYPKNKYIMFMKDQIELVKLENDWNQIEEFILDDLIDTGVAGTQTWVDNNGCIRINRVLTERMISNVITNNDFSDMIRIGQYEQLTISQLRSRVKKGTFTEEEYAMIASKGGTTYDVTTNATYFEMHNRYPYDHELVTVLNWECFSADDLAYVHAKDKVTGRSKLIKKDNPDWLGDKSDEDYKKYNQSIGEYREVLRESINNIYKCSWIVDTELVFSYGPAQNTLRTANNLRDVESGFTMYTLDFDSIIRQVEPVLDNIQINWLQYQHHLAQSKPKGLAIEKRALGMVDLGNGQKLSSGKILQMYAETGSYIYVGTDQNGRPYPYKPLEELQGGISEAAKQHLDFIIMQIDVLRGILGLNEVTDASSVDPKLGKAVSEMVQFNTNNALGSLYHAFISIYERTARKIAMLVPDALETPNRARTEALGEANESFMKMMGELPFMSWGIKIEAGITNELRTRLTDHINASLKSNGGVLLPEDSFIIENEPNLQRAYLLLSQKRRLREREQMAMEMAKMQQQADGNTQTAVALEQEKRATAEAEVALYEKKKSVDTSAKIAELREKAQWDIIIMKLEKGFALEEQENQIVAKLMETEIKINGEMAKAKINATKKEKPVAKQ